jgi:hypothetical protein
MRPTFRSIAELLVAAACCAGFASASSAQGGWRQWDVLLRDGRRLEANPLGAPNDAYLALSVDGYDRRERRIARARVQVVAAQPLPGESLPPLPPVPFCDDAIVLRDGTITTGKITLARVRWSEGIVVQRRDTVDLRDVAYLVFATQGSAAGACRRAPALPAPDVVSFSVYPIGIRQMQRWCGDDCE